MAVRSAPSRRFRSESKVTNFLCVPECLQSEIYGIGIWCTKSLQTSRLASTPEKSCSSHGKCIFGWNMDACSITYNMNSMRTMWLCVLNQPTPYKLINKCNILFVRSTLDYMWFGNIPPRCSKRSVKLPILSHRRWYPHLCRFLFAPSPMLLLNY